MDRFRSAVRRSFRVFKRDGRGIPLDATDCEFKDVEPEFGHPSIGSSPDNLSPADGVLDGACSFSVKYYGCVSVAEPRGISLCRDAMKEARQRFRKRKRSERVATRSLTLQISRDSIRLTNDRTQTLVANEPIDKVSFCMADRSHKRAFCFVSRDTSNNHSASTWLLHAFKTAPSRRFSVNDSVIGERVCHAIGSAFEFCSSREKPNASDLQGLALVDDAFAIAIANHHHSLNGAAKLSPIAEEDSISAAMSNTHTPTAPVLAVGFPAVAKPDGVPLRHLSETDTDEHVVDDFENDASALLVRGAKARATIAVASQQQPPKPSPSPFSRDVPERRTIHTDKTPANPANEGSNSKTNSIKLRFSLRLPSALMKPKKLGEDSRKSGIKHTFKRPRNARLLSGSESADDDPPCSTTEATQCSEQRTENTVKNGQPATTATRVPRVISKRNEPTYGRLNEPKSTSAHAHGRQPLSSSSSVEADHSETENDGEPMRNLISKFDRSSVKEKAALCPNDDPFVSAPLSKSEQVRHSALR